jgi:hypothetical protein
VIHYCQIKITGSVGNVQTKVLGEVEMIEAHSVTVTWGDEARTFLNWNFQGQWTGADYFDSLVQLWMLMDSKSNNLNLLVDMQRAGKNPSNLVALMQAAIRNRQPCNIGRIVVITDTSYWQGVYEIACRHSTAIAELDVHFVATEPDANNLLYPFDR